MKYIKHLPLALFTSFCLKYLIIPIGYVDVPLMIILAGASCFFEFQLFNKEFQELKTAFEDHRKEYLFKAQEINELKTGLVGIKLGQSLRGPKIG